MSVISQFSSGGVKSVQSGTLSAAGTATITAVNTAKTVIYSISKGSAVTNGSSAVSLTATGSSGTQTGGFDTNTGNIALGGASMPPYTGTAATAALSTVTAKQFSAVLTNSTTITADGPVEWQAVEYY